MGLKARPKKGLYWVEDSVSGCNFAVIARSEDEAIRTLKREIEYVTFENPDDYSIELSHSNILEVRAIVQCYV